MKTIKPFQLGLLNRTFSKDKRFYLSVASLAYFPYHNSNALGTEQEMWEAIFNTCGTDMVFDLCMPKVKGEALMIGKCFAPKKEPTKQLYADFKMGDVLKRLVVTGDRYWKRGHMSQGFLGRLVDNEWEASEPVPFTEMDIGWQNSFGGEDFAHNPIGKGHIPKGQEPSADETSPLPNVERIDSLVIEPKYDAIPGGYGPIDLSWPARAKKLGKKYDKDWEKNRYPEPAVDMVPTYYNAAPPDQQLKQGFWEYGEDFTITNMHPDEPILRSNIPKIRQRCFVLQREAEKERWNEIALTPETVWLFPNSKSGILVSRGIYEVDTFYGVDVDTLLLSWELKDGKTRTIKDYRKSVERRQNKETMAEWVIRHDDISPPEGIPEEPAIFADEDAIDPKEKFGPFLEKQKQDMEAEIAKTKELLEKAGVDASKYVPNVDVPLTSYPDIPKLEKMSDIPKVMAYAKSEIAKANKTQADMVQKMQFISNTKQEAEVKIEKKAREICKRCERDYDELFGKSKKTSSSGPPKNHFQQFKDSLNDSKKLVGKHHPEKLPEIDAALGKIDAAEAQYSEVAELADPKNMLRENAHHLESPEPISAAKQQDRREWVVAKYKEDADFTDADLNGVDLSELDLKNSNFEGAVLDSTNFENTDLSGANLTKATLVRANLTSAILQKTNLTQANISLSTFNNASLTGSTVDETIVESAKFIGSTIADTHFKVEQFIKCDFTKANLSESVFNKVYFIQCCLNETVFNKASLPNSNFMSCEMHNVSFTEADLNDVSFTDVKATSSNFTNAQMENTNAHQESDFSKSVFQGVKSDSLNLASTNLSDTDFDDALLPEADFNESTLVNARFHRAIAIESNFTDADMREASFVDANLMSASFQGTILGKANFQNAHLFGADFLFSQYGEADFFGAVKTRSSLKDD